CTTGVLLFAACSPGYSGVRCARRCLPCPGTRTWNPLSGRCEGLLSCVRRVGPSCHHGLVSERCPGGAGWWYWDGHCYYVEESDAKTWQQAEAACSASGEGMGLLALNSLEEKAWVAAMVQRDSWTGLNDLDGDGSWTWAVAQHADGPAPWLASASLLPGGCLSIGAPGDSALTVSNCSGLKPWVCEGAEGPWSRCPTEPGWRHWNGSCYYWDSSLASSTWQEGLQVCRQFRQTELLYLTSRQEKDWVCSNFRGAFWTGLNDQTDESIFQWTTRDPITRQLAKHLRDDLADGGLKDCVWLDTASGLLTDASCEERKPFICKCSEATEWFVKQPGRAWWETQLSCTPLPRAWSRPSRSASGRGACAQPFCRPGQASTSSAPWLASSPDPTPHSTYGPYVLRGSAACAVIDTLPPKSDPCVTAVAESGCRQPKCVVSLCRAALTTVAAQWSRATAPCACPSAPTPTWASWTPRSWLWYPWCSSKCRSPSTSPRRTSVIKRMPLKSSTTANSPEQSVPRGMLGKGRAVTAAPCLSFKGSPHYSLS
ncbi:mannose receptor, C type 2, partial [Chelydra serpentina]